MIKYFILVGFGLFQVRAKAQLTSFAPYSLEVLKLENKEIELKL